MAVQLLTAFLIAVVLALVLTPLVAWVSHRLGLLKSPGDRHVHIQPMPHLGGVALVLAVLPVAMVFVGFSDGLLAFYVGALLIAGLGVLDDVYVLSAKVKLLGQVAAALAFALLGGQVSALTNPFGAMFQLGWAGVPLATLWVVAVINVVNLIDGLDGLAAGITALVAVAMMLVASHRGEGSVVILSAAVAGATAGFLRYNFAPARIFMGDTGSGFLGFALAAMAIIGSVKDTTALTLGAPIVALALPIFDTGFAILRRVRNGKPIGQGDRDHIHHRLLNRGLGQRRTVLLLYAITALFGAVSVVLVDLPSRVGIVAGLIVVALLLVAAARWGIIKVPLEEPENRTEGLGR